MLFVRDIVYLFRLVIVLFAWITRSYVDVFIRYHFFQRNVIPTRLFFLLNFKLIGVGAQSFLTAEYTICAQFVIGFGALVLVLISWGQGLGAGILTTAAFVIGAITSMVCGWIGMYVAVYSNARTTVNAANEGYETYKHSFNTAFRAGAVMGFALTGLGIAVMYVNK